MTLQVRIFGTLSSRFPGYSHAQGLRVELPSGAALRDLLLALRLERVPGVVALVDGRMARAEDPLRADAPVSLLRTMAGG